MGKNNTAKAVKMIAYRIGQAKKAKRQAKQNGQTYLKVFYDGVMSGLKLAWYDVTRKIWREN